jgi:hypothetical protein
MAQKKQPLQRLIRPSVPVTLELQGEKHVFQLAFDMTVLARIGEKTGLKLSFNIFTLWVEMSSAAVLGASFWSAALVNHPEYDNEEGFSTLRSFIGPQNVDDIAEALWKAYMLYLPKEDRELMERVLKEGREEKVNANPPQPPLAEETADQNTPNSTGSNSAPSRDMTLDSTLASSAS